MAPAVTECRSPAAQAAVKAGRQATFDASHQTLLAASASDSTWPAPRLARSLAPNSASTLVQYRDGAFLDAGVLDAADGAGDGLQQAGLLAVVVHLAVQRAGLAEVAVLCVQGVRGERELAVVLPAAARNAPALSTARPGKSRKVKCRLTPSSCRARCPAKAAAPGSIAP